MPQFSHPKEILTYVHKDGCARMYAFSSREVVTQCILSPQYEILEPLEEGSRATCNDVQSSVRPILK